MLSGRWLAGSVSYSGTTGQLGYTLSVENSPGRGAMGGHDYRILAPDGSVTEPKLFYDATSDQRPGAPDGMKVDVKGNVYSTGPGGVWIFTPEGKPLGIILMPEKSANVAWGGPDRRTLYITASSSIYRVHLNIPGAPLVKK